MLYQLGMQMVRYKKAVILFWLVSIIVSGMFAPKLLSELKGGFGESETESRRALNILAEKLDIQGASIIIVYSNPDLRATDPEYKAAISKSLEDLTSSDKVTDVTSFYSTGNAGFVSEDGHTSYVAVNLDATVDEGMDLYHSLRGMVQEPEGFRVWATGGIAIFSELNVAAEEDLQRSEAVSLPLVIAALALVFGTLVATSLPIAMAAITVGITMAIVYGIAQFTDVSIFVLNIASFLGIGIAIDYTLMIVSRFREELEKRPTDEAVAVTLDTAGRAILFSGITTVVGLSGLFFIPFMFFRSMGAGGVTVIFVSVLVALTLVPAILGILGHRVNSLRILRIGNRNRGVWRRVAYAVMAHPILISVPLMAGLILLGTPFLGVKLGTPWASVLPSDSEPRLGWEFVEDQLSPGQLSPVVIVLEDSEGVLNPNLIGEMHDFVHELELDPRVERIESIVTLDRSLNKEDYQRMYGLGLDNLPAEIGTALSSYGSEDVTIINVFSKTAPVSSESKALVEDIRAVGKIGNSEFLVTGDTADLQDSLDHMYEYFPTVILYIVIATYVVLLLLFRSVLLPLKAILMNAMSMFATYGALVFIFQQGHFQALLGFEATGYLEGTLPIILFCIVFGLSMDYEVFLLSRIKEHYDKTADNTTSVAIGLEQTGRIITSAAMILVLVAAAFATSDVIVVKAFGVGTALAIFLDSTVIRALLVPALMRIMGDFNWWAPSFLRGKTTTYS